MIVSPWVVSFLFEEVLPRYELAIVFNGGVMILGAFLGLFHIAACFIEDGYKNEEFILTKRKK